MKMKKMLFVLGMAGTIVAASAGKTNSTNTVNATDIQTTVSNDSFTLVSNTTQNVSQLYDINKAYNDFEYYGGDTFVKLVDKDNGFDKKPRFESYEYLYYGENNDKVLQTFKLCALYKCPTKKYREITYSSQKVNSYYSSLGVDITDATSGSISSTVSTEIGAGFGGFIEAGVTSALATEFGMEVGSSYGVDFEFTNSFTSQGKTFDLNVYEVYEKFLVITYTPSVTPVKKSSGWLWWYMEWTDSYKITYNRRVYLFETPAEVVFDYSVR